MQLSTIQIACLGFAVALVVFLQAHAELFEEGPGQWQSDQQGFHQNGDDDALLLADSTIFVGGKGKKRKRQLRGAVYVRSRSTHWYSLWWSTLAGEESSWQENFRINAPLFQYLMGRLGPDLALQDTRFRRSVPVRKQMLIGLYFLAQAPMAMRQIGDKFGVGEATASRCVSRFCTALITAERSRVSFYFQGPALLEVMQGFERQRGLKNVCGAIDCTHVRHSKPRGVALPSDYVDRHQNFSTVMQAIVDSNCRFLDVYIGWPGSVHDTRIFYNSSFAYKVLAHSIMQEPILNIQGVHVLPYLVGDAGYPLKPYMMIPYPLNQLTQRKNREYNFKHSSTRMCVERSFGQLKNRWRVLGDTMRVRNMDKVQDIIFACVILHNLCLDFNISTRDFDVLEVSDPVLVHGASHDAAATAVREAIAQDLLSR